MDVRIVGMNISQQKNTQKSIMRQCAYTNLYIYMYDTLSSPFLLTISVYIKGATQAGTCMNIEIDISRAHQQTPLGAPTTALSTDMMQKGHCGLHV